MRKRSAALIIGFIVTVVIGGVVLFWSGLNPGSVWSQVFISLVALLVFVTVIALGRQATIRQPGTKTKAPAWTKAVVLATVGLLLALAVIIGLLIVGKALSSV